MPRSSRVQSRSNRFVAFVELGLTPIAGTGRCGQAPRDHPEFARLLVESGIESMSVSPVSFMRVEEHLAAASGRSWARPPPERVRSFDRDRVGRGTNPARQLERD